jgi:hypothetical protein
MRDVLKSCLVPLFADNWCDDWPVFDGTVVVEPAVEQLPSGAHLLFRQQLIPRLQQLAPPLMISVLLCSVFVTSFRQKHTVRPYDDALSHYCYISIGEVEEIDKFADALKLVPTSIYAIIYQYYADDT